MFIYYDGLLRCILAFSREKNREKRKKVIQQNESNKMAQKQERKHRTGYSPDSNTRSRSVGRTVPAVR